MTTDEFLVWDNDDGCSYQLIDGSPRKLASEGRSLGRIKSTLRDCVTNSFNGHEIGYLALEEPGVIPAVLSEHNVRRPFLAISQHRAETEGPDQSDRLPEIAAWSQRAQLIKSQGLLRLERRPVAIFEIDTGANSVDVKLNVWTYLTISSVQEIVVLNSSCVHVQHFKRLTAGDWSGQPEVITDGGVYLETVNHLLHLPEIYAE